MPTVFGVGSERPTQADVRRGTGSGSVHPTRTFKSHGLSSVLAVELRNRLASATGLALPPGLV
ncbi:acyl carrier protein [Streptomyces sp. NPDC052052]|uniref:acyl carrier protein n=1 Tax=Streptomyces sp. NPDC052052 TaxID=3154756 RepID=UPI003440F55B